MVCEAKKRLVKHNAEACAVEISGGRFGGCLQSKFFGVVLSAVKAVAGKRASSHFVFVGGGSGARARRNMSSRIGRLLDERVDLCDAMAMVLGAERKRQGSGRTRRPSRRRMIGRRSWAATLPVQAHEGLIPIGANSESKLSMIKK